MKPAVFTFHKPASKKILNLYITDQFLVSMVQNVLFAMKSFHLRMWLVDDKLRVNLEQDVK